MRKNNGDDPYPRITKTGHRGRPITSGLAPGRTLVDINGTPSIVDGSHPIGTSSYDGIYTKEKEHSPEQSTPTCSIILYSQLTTLGNHSESHSRLSRGSKRN